MTTDLDMGVSAGLAPGEEENGDSVQIAAEPETDEGTLSTQGEPEEDFSITLEELLGTDDKENADTQGKDSPPSQEKPAEATQEKPADYYRSQDEVDAVVQKRLKQAREKWEREQSAKLPQGTTMEQLLEADLEKQARELIAKSPEMKLSLDVAKMIVKGQQKPAPVQQETQPADEEAARTAKVEAWKESLITEEPQLRLETSDATMTVKKYAETDSVFKTALTQGLTPLQAHAVTKAVRAVMQQELTTARAQGEQNVLSQIKQSNSKATAPIPVKTTGGTHKSLADLTGKELIEAVMKADRQGKKLRVT